MTSTDGDRSAYRWPTFPNNYYHSFEAYNDWVQLLEEYGLIGSGWCCSPRGLIE